MKQLFLVVIVTMASFSSSFATNGYMPYWGTMFHHKQSDARNDLDTGCTWELFCDHHSIGWNKTLIKLARRFGGGPNSDNSGVTFTYKGKVKNLPFINGDDYDGIFTTSKIIPTNLKKVRTSARVAWGLGYEYYERPIHIVDGKAEMFFAKSLGEYYNDPDLNEIIFLHCLDVCGNPNEEYLISEQSIEEESRPGKQPTKTVTTPEGTTIHLYVDNHADNHNDNHNENNSNSMSGTPSGSTSWNPAGVYYNDQVGNYGYGAPWLTARAGLSWTDPMLYGGGGCNNQFYDDGCNYDRGYRPRTDNGWGSQPRPRNDRGFVKPTIQRQPVVNGGGPRGRGFNPDDGGGRGHGFNSGDGGVSRGRGFNPGDGGGVRGRR